MPSCRPLFRLMVATSVAAALLPAHVAFAQASGARTPDDSAAIVAAAWEQTSGLHRGHRSALFRFPIPSDTVRRVPLSPAVRAGLERRGVPITERAVVGDDTVLFHVARWEDDSSGATLELRSGWTTVLGAGARRCRTGSGNVERVVVRRTSAGWRAAMTGPVVHGDRVCARIPAS